jgi:hypothetical protein
MYKIFVGGVNADSLEAPGSNLNFSRRLGDSAFNVVLNPIDADFAICVDNNKFFKASASKAKMSKERSILIRNEPVVVCPENKLLRTRSRFGLSLNMGRPPSKSEDSVAWPQQWPKEDINFDAKLFRDEKIALVNGNKISFISGELYSLRRKVIVNVKSLDLYGTSWDLSVSAKARHVLANLIIAIKGGYLPRISGVQLYFRRFPNWKGAPTDKREVLSNYKYCLVIENSTEFMTEKLFDAFFAGCIPIYVGPDLKDFSIPGDLYFQAKPNLKSINERILEASKIDYLSWRIKLIDWINLDSTKKQWSSDEVNSRVIKAIEQYCQKIIQQA